VKAPTLERIARSLKPSAESFAAAAAVYSPDLMLHLQVARAAAAPVRKERRRCLAR
jgi:hypothetical protein